MSFFLPLFVAALFPHTVLSRSLPPSLCLLSLFLCFTADVFTSLFSVILSYLFLIFLPNRPFSLHSFPCLAPLFFFSIPCLFSLFLLGFLSSLSSLHFRPTATSHTSSQKQLVHLKEQLGLGKVNFVCIF